MVVGPGEGVVYRWGAGGEVYGDAEGFEDPRLGEVAKHVFNFVSIGIYYWMKEDLHGSGVGSA